jgi:hypothetical protein
MAMFESGKYRGEFRDHVLPAVFFLSVVLSLMGCQITCPAPLVKTAKGSSLLAAKSPEILAGDMSFDFNTGEIRYTLPEPALVRIRMGIQNGGPLLTHIVDWEYREKGTHVETWDKKGAGGYLAQNNRKDIMLVISCLPPDSQDQRRSSTTIKGFRPSPKFTVKFPEAQGISAEGHPILQGMSPVRITVDQTDQMWLKRTKFELAMFLDSRFVAEDEEGTNPYTYRLDTLSLPNGIHVITVNIVGYEGEVGTQNIMVEVKNDVSL